MTTMNQGSDAERYEGGLQAAGLGSAADLAGLDSLSPVIQEPVLRALGEMAFGSETSEGVRRLAERGLKLLPREWLLERLDTLLAPHLAHGRYDEYNRMAWLLRSLDRQAYLRHVELCRQHADAEIQELGEDLWKMAQG